MTKAWRDAAVRGDVEAVRSQLKAGASINALDRYGQSALMLAALHGHAGVARLLILDGAALNLTSKFGLSALMLAVVNLHTEVSRLLVEAGADLDIQGRGAPGFAGKTAADLAEDNGQLELAAYIRERGRTGRPT